MLLEARGAASDVIVNADVTSGSGNITLDAEDDVQLTGTVTVSTTGGDVYLLAENQTTTGGGELQGIDMAQGTSITTGGAFSFTPTEAWWLTTI